VQYIKYLPRNTSAQCIYRYSSIYMFFTPHHPSLCSVGGVIAAGGLLPACGHPNCDSRGSFPGPALCRVCEEGHGPYQHCCHDGGRCCLCWPYHRRSVSQTMHRLATELHNAQCTVACTALQLSCTVHSAMHSTAQHSTAQHSTAQHSTDLVIHRMLPHSLR